MLEGRFALLTQRLVMAEQCFDATSHIAGQLDAFAAQLATNKARLEDRLLEMAISARLEQSLLQT